MDVIADLFIGVLGFQKFAMQTSGYGQMIYNLVNSLGSAMLKARELNYERDRIIALMVFIVLH